MNFGYLTYNIMKTLIDYSGIIDGAIASYKTAPSIGAVSSKDHEEYWEQNNQKYICYGRYLQFQNANGKLIKFWTGLNFKPNDVDFIVWFKKADIEDKYVDELRNIFEPIGQFDESNEEVWIIMDNNSLASLCDEKTASGKKEKLIKDFWDSVFRVLN